MKKAIKWIAIVVGGLIVLIIAALLIIPMFVDRRTSESRYNLDVLQERFGDQVLDPVPVQAGPGRKTAVTSAA